MHEPDESSPEARAERLFAEFLAGRAAPDERAFEALVESNAELAEHLRELHRDWRSFGETPAELFTQAAPLASRGSGEPGNFRVAQFVCLRPIGAGGMGEVWEADDLELKRRVALKLLPLGVAADSVEAQRFRREAEAAGRIRHPAIVAVYSAGVGEGRAFIAYELVPGGRTLRQWIDDAARADGLAPDHDQRVARWFATLCDALESAHASGAIHRDLKPQNVLLTPDGEPKLTDFGLAKLAGESSLSRTGSFVGTWPYASPEQISSSMGSLDARSDVFSLGVTLYECLSLRRPFVGDSTTQIAQQILEADPPDPRAFRSRCPRDLAVIALKAIEKRRDRRYASMREFGDDLRRFLAHEPISAHEPTVVERALKWTRRHPTAAATILISAIGFVAASGLYVDAEHARRATDAANLALREASAQALENAQRANLEAQHAREESAISRQVTDFVLGMFDDANPDLSEGSDITANQLLERALERVRGDRSLELQTRARVEERVAVVFAALGHADETRELLFEACDLFGGPDGETSSDAEDVRGALASELAREGEFDAGFQLVNPLIERALERDDCSASAIFVGYRAQMYLHLARYAESEVDFQLSANLAAAAPEPELTQIADALVALSAIHRVERRTDETEAELVRARELYVESLGADHVRTVSTIVSLGVLRQSQGRLVDAEALFRDAWVRFARSLGANHPRVLQVRGNLAIVLAELRKLDEAIALLRDAVATREKDAEETDSLLLSLREQLTTCLIDHGDAREAVPLAENVRRVREKLFGDEHPSTLWIAQLETEALLDAKDFDRASVLAARTLELTPPNSPLLEARRKLADEARRAVTSAAKN